MGDCCCWFFFLIKSKNARIPRFIAGSSSFVLAQGPSPNEKLDGADVR